MIKKKETVFQKKTPHIYGAVLPSKKHLQDQMTSQRQSATDVAS